MSRPIRTLVLATDEDDAIRYVTTDPDPIRRRLAGVELELVWPTAFMRIAKSAPFDGVIVTPNMAAFPEQGLVENWVRICMLRVKGADGLTVGGRLVAGEV
jgi:hypothetical protein